MMLLRLTVNKFSTVYISPCYPLLSSLFFTVLFFLQQTVNICNFSRLTAEFLVILRLSVNLIRILSLPLPIRRKRETIIFHTFFVWEPANKPFLLPPPPPLVILNLLTVCCTSKMLFQRKTYHGKQNLHNVTSGREKINTLPPPRRVC